METKTIEEALLLASVEMAQMQGMSLRVIARGFGRPVTHADIQRILQGVFPVGAKKRSILGLPALVPTVACSACGDVHAYDRACEMTVIIRPKTQRKPRAYKDLWDWPVELLRSAIKNREEM